MRAIDTRADTATAAIPLEGLYQVGAVAAVLSALFVPIQVLVYIVWPPPSTVMGWFALFQDSRVVGLIDLDLFLVADNVLLVPIFLALYQLLKRVEPAIMALVTVLGILAAAMFIASNPAFEMLLLSNRYAVATSEGERSLLLAAGEVMLATWEGTAFQVAYFLGSGVGLTLGFVMLRSSNFSKMTAWMGILGNAVAFGYYLPLIGIYLALFSVLFLEIWYILLARGLFQVGLGLSSEQKIGS